MAPHIVGRTAGHLLEQNIPRQCGSGQVFRRQGLQLLHGVGSLSIRTSPCLHYIHRVSVHQRAGGTGTKRSWHKSGAWITPSTMADQRVSFFTYQFNL